MTRNAHGPGGSGHYDNSLGLVGMADRFTGEAFDGGRQSMLGPILMYLYSTFVVPDLDAFIAGKQTPCRETFFKRTRTWFFDAGKEVYELVLPTGSCSSSRAPP